MTHAMACQSRFKCSDECMKKSGLEEMSLEVLLLIVKHLGCNKGFQSLMFSCKKYYELFLVEYCNRKRIHLYMTPENTFLKNGIRQQFMANVTCTHKFERSLTVAIKYETLCDYFNISNEKRRNTEYVCTNINWCLLNAFDVYLIFNDVKDINFAGQVPDLIYPHFSKIKCICLNCKRETIVIAINNAYIKDEENMSFKPEYTKERTLMIHKKRHFCELAMKMGNITWFDLSYNNPNQWLQLLIEAQNTHNYFFFTQSLESFKALEADMLFINISRMVFHICVEQFKLEHTGPSTVLFNSFLQIFETETVELINPEHNRDFSEVLIICSQYVSLKSKKQEWKKDVFLVHPVFMPEQKNSFFMESETFRIENLIMCGVAQHGLIRANNIWCLNPQSDINASATNIFVSSCFCASLPKTCLCQRKRVFATLTADTVFISNVKKNSIFKITRYSRKFKGDLSIFIDESCLPDTFEDMFRVCTVTNKITVTIVSLDDKNKQKTTSSLDKFKKHCIQSSIRCIEQKEVLRKNQWHRLKDYMTQFPFGCIANTNLGSWFNKNIIAQM